MNKDKKNQIILVGSVVFLIIAVIVSAIVFNAIENDKEVKFKVTFDQLYNSDYDLHYLDKGYFFGTYDNKINVFIDGEGREILKTDNLISYDNFYKMMDGRYLFYSNVDNVLNVYIFDGKSFNLDYSINDVSYVKPIVNDNCIMGFTSFDNNVLYLYNLDDGGIHVLNNATLMADKFVNNVYYSNNSKYIVVENKDELYGVVNINGETIIDYKYKDIISLNNDNFIVKTKKDKYGIIDINGKSVVTDKYDGIIPFDDNYIFIKGKKMALFNSEYDNVTGFKMRYNDLLGFNYRSDMSVNLYNVGDKIIVVNNYHEDLYKRDYQYHEMYVIEKNKIVDTITQVGFNNDNVIYSYDEKYNITIYDDNLSKKDKFKLKNVNKIVSVDSYSLDTLLIKYIDSKDKEVSKVFNYNGNSIDDAEEVLLSNSVYYVVYSDNKLIIRDYDGNGVSSVVGNVVYIDNDYIIVDHVLYRLVIE